MISAEAGAARPHDSGGLGTAAPTGADRSWRRRTRRAWASVRYPVLVFAAVAVVLYAVAELSFQLLDSAPISDHGFPDYTGFNAWTRWDTDWYLHIARDGYFYDGPGHQSAVAFFPGYPTTVRAFMVVLRNDIVSGVVVTYLAGLTAVVLLYRWCQGALGTAAARAAVLALVLFPFAFYLFGAVYSDALFLAAVLGAFVLLERGHPWLSGIVGALAVAGRPFGLLLTAGLAIRALELRGVLKGAPGAFVGVAEAGPTGHGRPPTPWLPRINLRALNWRDAGVLLSVLGLVGYCLLLWWRFDDPFAFRKVYSADGWGKTWDAHTMLKVEYFRHMRAAPLFDFVQWYLTAQALLTLIGLALIPMVFRRLGWGYGLYALLTLAVPALGTREFLSTGRYALAVFPCFAVAGAQLAKERPRLATSWFVLSGIGGAFMMSLYHAVVLHQLTGDYPPATVDPDEFVAAARAAEASETFPRQAIERIRVATNWLSVDQPLDGDVRHAALLLQRQAGVDLEPPMGSRGRGQAIVKQVVRRLIGWYVRFLGQQISALGQASARLGLAVSERTERLEADAAADRAALDTLGQHVSALEARLGRSADGELT